MLRGEGETEKERKGMSEQAVAAEFAAAVVLLCRQKARSAIERTAKRERDRISSPRSQRRRRPHRSSAPSRLATAATTELAVVATKAEEREGRRRRSVLAPSCSAAAAAVDWGQGRRRRTLFQSPLGFFAAAIDSAAAGRSRKGRGGRRQTRRHQLQPSPKLGQIHRYRENFLCSCYCQSSTAAYLKISSLANELPNELPNGAIIFLDEIDGFEQDKKVVVIAATNRKEDLDPALISRFDTMIPFGLPDHSSRQQIASKYAKHLTKPELDEPARVIEEPWIEGFNEKPAPLPKDVSKIYGQLPALKALNLSNNLMSLHKSKLPPL
ncbi:ATP-dependent zinc metalloprotease FtsH [Arachis hypogaea]|nr:ATP-dependent zinc metalloprotease FtsH [Arachis hypogaea]